MWNYDDSWWFPIGFLGCPVFETNPYSNPFMTVATVAKGLAWIGRNKKADTTLAPNSLQSRKFITHQSPSLHEGQTRPIFVIKLYHLLIIHISSLPEGKDSLFRWPSDDKRKSEGPGSEKQVDQLERIAKISKDIMESQGISLYFFNFNKFQQLPRGAFRDFPFNQLQNAEKMTALRPASARGRLLWQLDKNGTKRLDGPQNLEGFGTLCHCTHWRLCHKQIALLCIDHQWLMQMSHFWKLLTLSSRASELSCPPPQVCPAKSTRIICAKGSNLS